MKQKHWQVSVFDKTSEIIRDDTFYTTDTEAYLVFELIDEDFSPDSAMVTVYNIYGTALINASVEVANGIVRYEMPKKAIRHSGGWRTQAIFTKDNEDYTTRIIEFDVGGHLLDNKKPHIVEIENWNSLIKHAGELIDDWEQLEEIRQANEQQRELAESARQTTFETNESTRQSEFETNETSRQTNELVREEAESNRQSTFEENELARESAESVRVSNEAERILKDSERDSKIEAVEGLQADLISGAVDSAAVQQHVEERYGQLEEKYAPKLTEVTTQLAQTEELSSRSVLSTRENIAQTARNQETIRPLVSFIDDDGYNGVLTKLKPLFTSRNVPLGVALMSTSQVVVDPEKRAEILDLQDNHGWEVLSHTMGHINIDLASAEEYEKDTRDFIRTFSSYGFNVQSIVYPWGKQESHRDITAKYYSSGFGTGGNYNDRNTLNNYAINRFGLGSSYSPDMNTFEDFKRLIDDAKTNNRWLVFMTHVDDPASDLQMIEDVLDYVIEQEIEIVAPSDGVRVFGSIVQSGRRNKGKYFNIKPEGLIDTNAYSLPGIIENKSEDSPPNPNKEFGVNMFVASDWSVGNGVVTEYLHSEGWQYQELRRSGNDARVYVRRWDVAGRWRPWFKYAIHLPDYVHTVPTLTLNANSTYNVSIPVTGSLARYKIIASPAINLENGIMYNCYMHGNGTVRLRLANITNAPITLQERVWNIAMFDPY